MSTDTARLREASGVVTSDDRLVAFLYLLMRNRVPCGRVAAILNELDEHSGTAVFTNGWLAEYAKDCAARLHTDKPRVFVNVVVHGADAEACRVVRAVLLGTV